MITRVEDGGTLELVPRFLDQDAADRAFAALRDEIPWETRSIRIMGKVIPQPRLVAYFADPGAQYTYSGLTLDAAPMPPLVTALRRSIERHTGERFNAVLLNLYRDGDDSMGMHADDEPELGKNPVIASLSLGETRTFKLRHVRDKAAKHDLPLAHGDLLVMGGTLQHFFRHGVAKVARGRVGHGDPVGPRINLTFRWIAPRA